MNLSEIIWHGAVNISFSPVASLGSNAMFILALRIYRKSTLVSRHITMTHRRLTDLHKSSHVANQGHRTERMSLPSNAPSAAIEQEITPWDVRGEVVDGFEKAIDYEKLMKQFGCQPLTDEMIERMERLTGKKAHVLIRRGMFYCHR